MMECVAKEPTGHLRWRLHGNYISPGGFKSVLSRCSELQVNCVLLSSIDSISGTRFFPVHDSISGTQQYFRYTLFSGTRFFPVHDSISGTRFFPVHDSISGTRFFPVHDSISVSFRSISVGTGHFLGHARRRLANFLNYRAITFSSPERKTLSWQACASEGGKGG